MNHTHDIVVTTGTYIDKNTGAEKRRYLTIGKMFTDTDGRQSLKIEAFPVGVPEFKGWAGLYPIKDRASSD